MSFADAIPHYHIRPALVSDADSIARLITQTLGDTVQVERISQIIAVGKHATHLLQMDTVVGFVDAFETYTPDGQLRWEVDLLGVHDDMRGRGFAQKLIARSIEYGRSCGAVMARAWVAAGNTPAEKAFVACGFKSASEKCMLLISDGAGLASADCQNSHLIPVQTMTYSGIWLEDAMSDADLACGIQARAESGADLVGTLIPVSQDTLLVTAERLGFTCIGSYRSFTLALD